MSGSFWPLTVLEQRCLSLSFWLPQAVFATSLAENFLTKEMAIKLLQVSWCLFASPSEVKKLEVRTKLPNHHKSRLLGRQ
ncbi:MAG: hypothetical protein H7240_11320 [Glaciimonas sp.]|nr:hypothetical protein [Glaciimonas sp.]